ncbi:mediator of RNA polymerase II transcription subunit 12-like [Camellia sinensis]|uniref:mediator of RNA polymerase II transcription subunit 12-like n=1 Tax=Camellia sinensis TaxID=4442 RepID=UPI001036CE8A|nr:mediator of RNA polymerase II transcription subunit 12-like [Camellia sinensis]
MGRPKPVAVDLLADLPADVDAVPTQSMPPPKQKRIKKAQKPKRTKRVQPKAKVTQVESEDALPISKLAESKKTSSAPAKRSAENPPSESTQSKKPRSASATTSGFKKPDVPWAPKITLEDRPIMSSENADDINVGVALSTALLLPGDLERNAEYSEYENYALMLQHSVQLNIPDDSPLRKADAIPLPFPPPPPSSQPEGESESESEDADKEEDEALVRKSKDDNGAKSPPQIEQDVDLTHEEDEDVIKETTPEQASSDVPPVDRSLDQTLAEIDAEIAADEEAEVSLQETSEVQIQQDADVEKS